MARKNKVTIETDAKTGKAKKNLKDLDAQARKTGKGFGQTAKGGRSADRAMKGVSAQSSSGTKNFSKMSQGMTGGLVPAYATLAAQIFAVTALFRFLKEAADYRVLIEGQKAFAAETGIAYRSIARSMQEATDGQITYKDASQAAAIGSAAGLNPDQLNRLAGAAKNVSIALGRDVTDSFNRLIRGTTKAEPELLDELGIILRLDDATKNYAAQIGKTKETLTIFEKSQAVTNEVLSQAESKFGSIGNNAELQVNAIAQFAKAFDDVINKVYTFIGPIAEGLARFFTKNIPAFIGALLLFAIPIIKMILPAFDAWQAKAIETAARHKGTVASMKKDLLEYKAVAAAARDKAGFAKGSFQATAGKMGLTGGARGKAVAIAHYETQTTQLMNREITKRTGMLATASAKDVAILKGKYAQMQTSTLGFSAFMKRTWMGISANFNIGLATMRAGWSATMAFFTTTARITGVIVNRFLLPLTILISVAMLAWDMAKGLVNKFFGTKFGEEDPLMPMVESAKELNKELRNMAKRFNEKVGGPGTLKSALDTAVFKGNMAQSANLQARIGDWKGATGPAKSGLFAELKTSVSELAEVDVRWKAIADEMERTGTVSKSTEQSIKILNDGMMNAKMAAEQFKTAQLELNKAMNAFLQSAGKMKYGSIIQQYRLMREGASNLLAEQRAEFAGLSHATGSGNMKRGLTMEQEERWRELKRSIPNLEGAETKAAAGEKQFLGYSTRAATIAQEKQALEIQKMQITRSGQSAQYAKKQFDIEKNLKNIKQKRLDIEIAQNVLDSKDANVTKEQKEAAKLTINAENQAIQMIEAKNNALEDSMDTWNNVKVAAVDALEAGIGNALMGVLEGTKSLKEGFLDMAKAVIQAIAQIIVKMLAMEAIKRMGLSFADGGVIPKASGGYIGSKKPRGYRSGGIAREPTYLVGEGRYNEAVVPLPDGRSIPVEMKGGASSNVVVNVNIASDGQSNSSLSQNDGQQAAQLGRAVSAAVQEELHKQQRPGGMLSPYGP